MGLLLVKNLNSDSNLYFYGDLDESANSVSFRKIINSISTGRIYLNSRIETMYINESTEDSDRNRLEEMKSNWLNNDFIIFNLQNVSEILLEDLSDFIKSNKITNYIILNSYSSYNYLVEKIGNIENNISFIDSDKIDTLISINETSELIDGYFKNKIVFNDKECDSKKTLFIPLNSIYEKSGNIIDQEGNKLQITRGAKGDKFSLEEFFK